MVRNNHFKLILTFETVMSKYTGCCYSILKSGKQGVCFILARQWFPLSWSEGWPSATLCQAPLCELPGSGKVCGEQVKQRGNLPQTHSQACPAGTQLQSPGEAGGGSGGRVRSCNLPKTKDLQEQPHCTLQCQTKPFKQGARKSLAFYCTSLVVEEGRTYPSIDRPWH